MIHFAMTRPTRRASTPDRARIVAIAVAISALAACGGGDDEPSQEELCMMAVIEDQDAYYDAYCRD